MDGDPTKESSKGSSTAGKYRAENPGDWGTAPSGEGGPYGTDTFALPDGTTLFYRYWQSPQAEANPRADTTAPVLVLLHGLGAHSGWFIDMGNELHARGLNVYMPDHRGFGRSGGARGHVRDWRVYPADTSAFLDEVRRRTPGAPLVVLGHSMGARFALYVAAQDARQDAQDTAPRSPRGGGAGGWGRLDGLVLVNPWVKEVSRIPAHKQVGIGLRGMRGSPAIVDYPYDVATMTANPEAHELLRADPNWVKQQSASFLYQVGLRMAGGLLKQAHAVRCPALVLQSDADQSVQIKHTRKLYDALGSKDKTYKTFPGFAHDFEFEPGRAVLDEDIVVWCANHTAGK